MPHSRLFFAILLSAAVVAGCDSNITGTPFENQPPSTQVSVRDTSLVENLSDFERLASTVAVSWTGSDPDGYVAAFELRYFDRGTSRGPEEGWVQTTRSDTLILLPIPRGAKAADVVFEVRAIDNLGLKDPRPARTVFPIQNSPPEIRLNTFELPPDTTFSVFSFAWVASDPEGSENLDRIEISFNDSTSFVALPPEMEFVSFVADVDRDDPGQTVAEARVYSGRGFQRTEIRVPGLRLDDTNTLYLRAVDATDTTSARREYSWYVKKPKGRVLLVNDYRKSTAPMVAGYHLDLLREYLPPGEKIDVWDLTQPYFAGSTGNVPRSTALPPNPDPTLRQTFALWDYIYWISTNTVNQIPSNNMPFASGALDLFFNRGGKMMVHSPATQPASPEDNIGNPAILLLPMTDILVRPDSLTRMELPRNAEVTPVQQPPGVGEPLPQLKSNSFLINELPYYAQGANVLPLYEADFDYLTRDNRRGPWDSPRTVASISADRRIALFALPLVNELSGAPMLLGADGDPNAPRRAIMLMLESLGFPR